jgi:hypothetical protein
VISLLNVVILTIASISPIGRIEELFELAES